MKGYSTLSWSLELEPHYQMQFSVIFRTLHFGRGLTLQSLSAHCIKPFGQVHKCHIQSFVLLPAFLLELSEDEHHVRDAPVFVQGDDDCIAEITWKFALLPTTVCGAYCVMLVLLLSRALVESCQLSLPCHSSNALWLW